MSTIMPPDFISTAINREIRHRVDLIIAEEAEAAHARVMTRMKASIDAIVLSVHQSYSIERMQDRLVITVQTMPEGPK